MEMTPEKVSSLFLRKASLINPGSPTHKVMLSIEGRTREVFVVGMEFEAFVRVEYG